jgi:hypothetical protein
MKLARGRRIFSSLSRCITVEYYLFHIANRCNHHPTRRDTTIRTPRALMKLYLHTEYFLSAIS